MSTPLLIFFAVLCLTGLIHIWPDCDGDDWWVLYAILFTGTISSITVLISRLIF